MNIAKNDLKKKPKRIGHLKGVPVYEIITKGGYVILSCNNKSMSAGPHRAIATIIAQDENPDLVIDELSKSEVINRVFYKEVIELWSDISKSIREQV